MGGSGTADEAAAPDAGAPAAASGRPLRACNLCGSTRRTDAGIGPLQTCARCRKVYYCCPRHHVDHWGVHKASCPRPLPPAPGIEEDKIPAAAADNPSVAAAPIRAPAAASSDVIPSDAAPGAAVVSALPPIPIVDFCELLARHGDAVARLGFALKRRGFCLLHLPKGHVTVRE